MAVGTAAALVFGLAACGSGGSNNNDGKKSQAAYNAGVSAVVNASEKKGGTLKMGFNEDADSWDPVRAYYAWVWNFDRFYTRTLLTADAKPGDDGLKLVPDLAQDEPKITDDGKT